VGLPAYRNGTAAESKGEHRMTDTADLNELLNPLCRAWLGKIELAKARKEKDFDQYARQCMQFYSGAVGFMYDPQFQRRYFGGTLAPKFKITLAKAFELVAIFGPLLYARNPQRRVTPFRWPEFNPAMVAADVDVDLEQMSHMAEEAQQQLQQAAEQAQQAGMDPQMAMDPQAMQIVEQFGQVQQYVSQMADADRMEKLQRDGLCQVAETYLNYTPVEQPDGGMEQAAEDAITEALIKGRGLLMPRVYTFPGGQTKLTGCFFKSVDDLLIDPDAKSAAFGEAWWIALEYTEPHFIAERRFGLPFGSLLNKGESVQSGDGLGSVQGHSQKNQLLDEGETFDLVTYYDIYSCAGVGTRLTGLSQPLRTSLESVTSDFCRIVVCEGVPWPLNAPMMRVAKADTEEVGKMFEWPVPYHKDRRWPVAMLDFYREPGKPWPISPLRPGLGELMCMNLIISHLVQRSWDSSITLIAVLKRALKELKDALESGESFQIVPLSEANKSIGEVIQYIEKPEVSFDVWRILEHLFNLFDKRVGLSDLLYGVQSGGISRTATDVEVRQEKLSVRPDHMAKKVEAWQSNVARMEFICAHANQIPAESVAPFLGTVGTKLWQGRFLNAPEEEILREVVCRIESGSARKPNRQKDVANMEKVYQPLVQQVHDVVDKTGDVMQYAKLDVVNKALFEAMELDLGGFTFDDVQPPQPDDSEALAAEQQMAVEQQKAQLEMAKQAAQMELKQQEAETMLMYDASQAEQNLAQEAERHVQELSQSQEKHVMDMLLLAAEQRIKRLQERGKKQEAA
jgi:hypothetical protein